MATLIRVVACSAGAAATIFAANLAFAVGNANTRPTDTLVLEARADSTGPPTPIPSADISITATTTATASILSANLPIASWLAKTETINAGVLLTLTDTAGSTTAVIAAALSITIGLAYETKGVAKVLSGIDIAQCAVAMVATAHLLLTRPATRMVAKGIGAGGARESVLLGRIGYAARWIAAQGVTGAIGMVLRLAFAIATRREIIAATGRQVAIAGTEVGVFVAPVLSRRYLRFEAHFQEQVIDTLVYDLLLVGDNPAIFEGQTFTNMADGTLVIAGTTVPPAAVGATVLAIASRDAETNTEITFLLWSNANATIATTSIVATDLVAAAAATAATAIVTTDLSITSRLAGTLPLDASILGAGALTARAAAAVVTADLAITLGSTIEAERIAHILIGINVAKRGVTVIAGAEFFGAGIAAIMEAEGVAAGGIGKAVALRHTSHTP